MDGSDDVVKVTREAATSLRTKARVCAAEDAARLARRWRAYAIVVPWTTWDADSALFDALTRASGSEVIALSTILPSYGALRSAMQAALTARANPRLAERARWAPK